MSEEYEDELVTSHSDENPELGQSGRGPIAAASNEGSAVSDLYKKERKGLLGVKAEDVERTSDVEEYYPPED